MIAYPKDWRSIGQEVTTKEVEAKLFVILSMLGCKNLAFSGGLDSSLLLNFMCGIHRKIEVFTIGKQENHPDVVYARKMVNYCELKFNVKIEHHIFCPHNLQGETPIYKLLYNYVGHHANEIIAGDGVDEFMAGYYAHMDVPGEKTYYEYLRRLQADHLIPLDLDSGNVRVYLPYIDAGLISLLSQVPLSEKADKKSRKKFIVAMAKGKVPDEIINRRKYGLCDALEIK